MGILDFLKNIDVQAILTAIAPALEMIFQFLKTWWWVLLPFLFWKRFKFLWLWWRQMEVWVPRQKPVILEVRIPTEVVKPIRAMEMVLSGLFQTIYQPPDPWEKWIDGQVQLSYVFEIASIEGDIHFFIRLLDKGMRDAVESVVYSQYPEAEITETDDYTKYVPQDIPNKEWDLWGTNYRLIKPDPYPIKTYRQFETEREALEEKRVDPIATLLEAMAKIKKGEQLWIQIIAKPVGKADFPDKKYWSEYEKVKEELARRAKKPAPQKSMLLEAADILITGKPPEGPAKVEETIIPPEMKLTPGERDVLTAVEEKASKPIFETILRFIYLGKRDVFFKPNLRLAFGFFSSFWTLNCNALIPMGQPIITKIKKSWFLPLNMGFISKRRLYLRQRKLFRRYRMREAPFFPRPTEDGTYALNTEELATLFHFPGRASAAAPFMSRVESKKREAPPSLPVE